MPNTANHQMIKFVPANNSSLKVAKKYLLNLLGLT